ncbi:MAG TPA: ribonuclease HII [Candidatus Paceibacterota bacterium]
MQGKWLVGIDEVGRGPLAGPVGVGVVKLTHEFDWSLLEGVGDSKMVKPQVREALYEKAEELRAEGLLDYRVELVAASYIDRYGIVPALKHGMKKALNGLELVPEDCFIKLDGALVAPKEYCQMTIIKGDVTEPVIGFASILAKVVRDRHMQRLHAKYPEYGFFDHKGYGTPAHRAAIAVKGLSPVHRASYCQNILAE